MKPMSSISAVLAVSLHRCGSLGAPLGERVVEALVVERVLHRQHPLTVQHEPHVEQRERDQCDAAA